MSTVAAFEPGQLYVIPKWWGRIEIRTDGVRVVVLLVLPDDGTMLGRWGSA